MFSQPTVTWRPCNMPQSHLQAQTSIYPSGQLMTRIADVSPNPDGEMIPVVIVCQAEEGDGKQYSKLT